MPTVIKKKEVIGHIWLSLVIGLPVVRIVYLCDSGTCSLYPSIFWSSLAPLCGLFIDVMLAVGCCSSSDINRLACSIDLWFACSCLLTCNGSPTITGAWTANGTSQASHDPITS